MDQAPRTLTTDILPRPKAYALGEAARLVDGVTVEVVYPQTPEEILAAASEHAQALLGKSAVGEGPYTDELRYRTIADAEARFQDPKHPRALVRLTTVAGILGVRQVILLMRHTNELLSRVN